MNKFITTALTCTALVGASSAEPAGDSDWLELDREINGLASKLTTQSSTRISALLRGYYHHTDDDLFIGMGDDISGFGLNDVDLGFAGEVGDYAWRVSVDLDGDGSGAGGPNAAELEDAYLSWSITEQFDAMIGNFKPRILNSGSVHPGNQLFVDRTVLGTALDWWDTGVGVSGAYDTISWFFSLVNGSNASESDHFWAFRVEYALGAGVGDYEGAYGGGDDFNATAGFAYFQDDTFGSDNKGYAVDFWGQQGPLGFGAEVASLDDGATASPSDDYMTLPAGTFLDADSTPWDFTVSYLLNDEFEVAARYENLDDTDDTTVITLGVNWYQAGHGSKWQVNVSDVDNDVDDGMIITAGWSVGTGS